MRALLLQVLYTIRSERLLMEELNYNLLFRWFVGLNMDDPVWHPTTFTKNRDRLLAGDVAAAFFDAVQAHARAAGLLSDEHFTVDGTQLEAWASLKSFRCRDAAPSAPPDDPGNPTVDFHGERRRNDPPSTTEGDAHRKGQGKEAKCVSGPRADNRHGLVACRVSRSEQTRATMWRASSPMSASGTSRPTWRRRSAGVRLMVGPPGMRLSRESAETKTRGTFGWMKTVGKLRHRGVPLVDWQLTFAATPITWSACGIWRRRVPSVSPAPSSGSAHTRRTVVGRALPA